MKILFIGDIFGNTGRRVLAERLPSLLEQQSIDLCIANAENIAGGRGMTSNLYKKLRKYGVQVMTGGNHSFSVPDHDLSFMNNSDVLRPLNYPPGNIGKGATVFQLPNGKNIGIINLQGRTFMHEVLDCPFRTGLSMVEELRKTTPIIFIDFHAETTSEKIALARYLDGKISALIGTHTHVQTADEKILSGGTAFLSDAGMTGPEDSVIGMQSSQVIKKFLLQTHVRYEPSNLKPMLNGVVIEIDDQTGHAISITRIFERISFS